MDITSLDLSRRSSGVSGLRCNEPSYDRNSKVVITSNSGNRGSEGSASNPDYTDAKILDEKRLEYATPLMDKEVHDQRMLDFVNDALTGPVGSTGAVDRSVTAELKEIIRLLNLNTDEKLTQNVEAEASARDMQSKFGDYDEGMRNLDQFRQDAGDRSQASDGREENACRLDAPSRDTHDAGDAGDTRSSRLSVLPAIAGRFERFFGAYSMPK